MRFDVIFNILYTPCKIRKTLKMKNKLISSFTHWGYKLITYAHNQTNNARKKHILLKTVKSLK